MFALPSGAKLPEDAILSVRLETGGEGATASKIVAERFQLVTSDPPVRFELPVAAVRFGAGAQHRLGATISRRGIALFELTSNVAVTGPGDVGSVVLAAVPSPASPGK
jgi:uncharacterized lipoprotein YbaY